MVYHITEGPRTSVNTTQVDFQDESSIATLADGGWIVTWTSAVSTTGFDVFQQRYGADGNPLGSETLVNTIRTDWQLASGAIGLPNGGWLVTWTSGNFARGITLTDIYQKQFDAGGTELSSETRVNTATSDYQVDPTVALLSDGGWVVAWTSYRQDGSFSGVYQQRFTSAGVAVGGEVQVNTSIWGSQDYVKVAALADGGWLAVWISEDQANPGQSARGLYQQRYDASGLAVGTETLVNRTSQAEYTYFPAVTGLPDGGWIVTWTASDPSGAHDIRQQRFDNRGAAMGSEFTVNSSTTGLQGSPNVAALPDGGWVVVWCNTYLGEVQMQRYAADGSVLGPETTVGLATSYIIPKITVLETGAWVVSWTDTDADYTGIFQRWFAPDVDGTAQNDTLAGTGLGETIRGYAGDDNYTVNNALDVIVEDPGAGTDSVRSSVTFGLGDNIENLTLTGSGDVDGIGNDQANILVGNAGNNRLQAKGGNDSLDGGVGIDVMDGGTGNDTYSVDDTDDVVVEAAGGGSDTVYAAASFSLSGNIEMLVLTGTGNINGSGNGLANTITGNAGANRLDGAGGADTMTGGGGDDSYIVDNSGDVVVEASGGGTDTVYSAVSYSLTANVENLVLVGVGNIDGTGNGLANTVAGNSGANVLDGGAGADLLSGGGGDDTYIIDNADDVVSEAVAAGTDTVRSSVNFVLGVNIENLELIGTGNIDGTGNALANQITGNAGNNVLVGGAGADTMTGGNGNDVYDVDSAGDVVIEVANGGSDTIRVAFTCTLGAEIENLLLVGAGNLSGTGNGSANILTGNGGNNTLAGLDGNDTLAGDAGDDILLGGAGADTMDGGAGNDSYDVDNAGDTVTESAGGGTDTVTASVSFVLGANVENLVLTGSATIDGTGNGLANALSGNSGNNLLDGGAGTDTMTGGGGNDVYVVDDVGDVVVEAANGGTDTLRASISLALGANVENLVLTGTASINGGGNALANRLTGNAGSNVLTGGAGADRMEGGGGNDTYDVDDAGDTVVEAAGGGRDTVRSGLSFVLADAVEDLVLIGSGDISGTGNALANSLTGNAGANVLSGGGGADLLQGGLGADRFVFARLSDTKVAERDTIADFSHIERDQIDLSAIDARTARAGDQAFTFIGETSRFRGSQGELRYTNSAGDTFVYGDVDGDKKADFCIVVDLTIDLVRSDFVL
jgi:Ca2+-binding RTX toxin-like protein